MTSRKAMLWRKPSTLPPIAEEKGGHKIRPIYFIIVCGQFMPDGFIWIAEEKTFTIKGANIHVDEVQAVAALGDMPYPAWVERHVP